MHNRNKGNNELNDFKTDRCVRVHCTMLGSCIPQLMFSVLVDNQSIYMCWSRGFNKNRLPAVYCRLQDLLPPPVWISLMKIKMILIKKQIQQQPRPLKFLNATQTARFLIPRTLEIAFPNFQISNFSGGACPQTPQRSGALWPIQWSQSPIIPSVAPYNLSY